MLQNLTNEKSTLVQVMVWCRQATNHCPSQCGPGAMSPYIIASPRWVKAHILYETNHIPNLYYFDRSRTLVLSCLFVMRSRAPRCIILWHQMYSANVSIFAAVYGAMSVGVGLVWSNISVLDGKLTAIHSLQWRHDEHDGVSNHRRLDCLPNRLF